MSSKIFGEDSIVSKYLTAHMEHLKKELENSFPPLDDIIKDQITELQTILGDNPKVLANKYDDLMRCYRRRSDVADRACEARNEALTKYRRVKDKLEIANFALREINKEAKAVVDKIPQYASSYDGTPDTYEPSKTEWSVIRIFDLTKEALSGPLSEK